MEKLHFHEAAEKGFGRAVISAYENGRPEHPKPFVRLLLDNLKVDHSSSILELGCGTGKYTRQLLSVLAESCPSGVEPNVTCADPADMCDKLREDFPRLRLLKTTACNLSGVKDESMDLVIAAQAFHWFADAASVAEIMRVLRPGGHFACVWNMRDPAYLDGRWESLLDSFYFPETPRQRSGEWEGALDVEGLGPVQHVRMQQEDAYEGDEETLIDYVLSISDISRRSQGEKDGIAGQFRLLLRAQDVPVTHRESDGKRMYRIPMFVDMYWTQKL